MRTNSDRNRRLQIIASTKGIAPVFWLKGRLAGLWVKEFVRRIRSVGVGSGALFNLEGVEVIDSSGDAALKALNHQGVKFIANSARSKALCSRLNLCRMTNVNRFTSEYSAPTEEK